LTSEIGLDAGTSASDILHKAYIPAMTEVGRLFEVGERFLPEMLIAARAMQAALEILKPQLVDTNVKAVGKLGMSALLTTTMTSISKTVEALTEAGVRDQVKVIIGGAPVTQAFADQVGADGYAEGAGGASRMARSLLGLA
jgi:5-methyltetrahydrofolate--homocysteine methyltransferase